MLFDIKYNVIRLRLWALPAVVLILSMVLALPVLNAEKADANAVKTVYFTFDDGPSEVTGKILDILREEEIKATFFVIGPSGEERDEWLLHIAEEGHAIGLHTMSHDYSKIYSDAESFIKDVEYEREWIYSVTGKECRIFRFPGGSNNYAVQRWLVDEVIEETAKDGMRWYDWNADGRDSLGVLLSPEEIAENVLSSEFIGSDEIIVLLHDSAAMETTPDALRILIDAFREMGYSFGKLD